MTARGSRSTKMQRAAGKSSRSSRNTSAFDGVFSLRYGAPCRSASGSNRSSINCTVSRSTSGAEAKASISRPIGALPQPVAELDDTIEVQELRRPEDLG